MPLGRQLSKLFNPGPAKSYDPNREALFAQMLASGSAPTNDIGGAIGNLAKFFVGQRGLKKQGQAYEEKKTLESEQLSQALAGLGLDIDPEATGTLMQNPVLLGESLRRSRPKDKKEKDRRIVMGPDKRNYYADTGELVLAGVKDSRERTKTV